MSSQRLLVLCPLMSKPVPRSAKALGASAWDGRSFRPVERPPARAQFRTTSKRLRVPETVPQRYGTANEPPPHLNSTTKLIAPGHSRPQQALPIPEPPEPSKQSTQTSRPTVEALQKTPDATIDDAQATSGISPKPQEVPTTSSNPLLNASGGVAAANSTKADQNQNALATILHMEPPMSEKATYKPPHLTAPPYVHHFDTYTLASDIQNGGFTPDQAVTIMKVVRAILADNMRIAQEGLLSKGDQEMETYLFKSACSELRTEIKNNRSTASSQTRTERLHVQHEVDILAQKVTSETSNLKDELKGMFDDRKMAVRTERRDVENAVQELNYQITTRLGSDMRSQVEGLRWVLVRRIAIAIVVVASMVLTGLRVSKYEDAKKDRERKLQEQREREFRYDRNARDGREGPDNMEEFYRRQQATVENPELVSLG